MTKRHPEKTDDPDEVLMSRYAAGDSVAFGALFERYEHRAYGFFLRRTGSPDRAQDLYQELFLRIHKARSRYDAQRPFAPWLFQIAHRLLVDDQRRAYRSHEVQLEDQDPCSEATGGEERFGELERLGFALALLSGEERHVLLSSKLDGSSYPELAASLGKSAQAIRQLASRATRRLRRELRIPGSETR